MSNSRRWKEFITWWNRYSKYSFTVEVTDIIDNKIEEITKKHTLNLKCYKCGESAITKQGTDYVCKDHLRFGE